MLDLRKDLSILFAQAFFILASCHKKRRARLVRHRFCLSSVGEQRNGGVALPAYVMARLFLLLLLVCLCGVYTVQYIP